MSLVLLSQFGMVGALVLSFLMALNQIKFFQDFFAFIKIDAFVDVISVNYPYFATGLLVLASLKYTKSPKILGIIAVVLFLFFYFFWRTFNT